MEFQPIPIDLPIPVNDGGSDHSPGLHVPSKILRSRDEIDIRPDDIKLRAFTAHDLSVLILTQPHPVLCKVSFRGSDFGYR